MGGLIIFLAVGLIAGWLAGVIMKLEGSLMRNLGVGVAGSFLGGFIGQMIGLAATGFIGAIIMSTIGAVVLLWFVTKMQAP